MTLRFSPNIRAVLTIGAVCVGLGMATVAFAADEKDLDIGRFSIGGRAMWFDPKGGDSSWSGGAQVRFYLFRFLAIEGSADYRQNDFNGTSVHSYPVQVSTLLYLFPSWRLRPFILGGVGWYYTTVDGPGEFSDTQNRFGVHAGGGLQYFISRHFSIDSTYRYVWLEDVASRNQNLTSKDFRDSGQMVTFGVNYHF
jgi:opacity protein-like surface antigen